MPEGTFSSIRAVDSFVILDRDGERILHKSYVNTEGSSCEQRMYEKSLYEQTKNSSSDIIMLNKSVVIYKALNNILLYMTFSENENELLMSALLECFIDALTSHLDGNVDKTSVLENYDILCVMLDEIIYNGVLMEIDSKELCSRVPKRSQGGSLEKALSDQTLTQAIQTAKYWKDQVLKKY